jgi:hypothetical protein
VFERTEVEGPEGAIPPTETKMSVLPGSQSMSYTERSWAMSWVTASISQTVQLVSTEAVTIRALSVLFQEKEVRGGLMPLLVLA